MLQLYLLQVQISIFCGDFHVHRNCWVRVQKTSCSGLKIPVLFATNETGDVLTSHKIIRFFTT